MKIKAIGFDIDGTLYPNYRLYIHSALGAAAHLRLFHHFGKIRKEIRKIRPVDDFQGLQAKLLGESFGISPVKAEYLLKEIVYGRWESTFRYMRPFPHLRTLIESLKKEGYRLGVLSDFPVEKKVDFLGLGGLWDATLSSEEVGYLKPNPEPFISLAEKLEVHPEDTLYVGNHYHYDVLGAKAAGMFTAHLSRRSPGDSQATFTFCNYKEFATKFHDFLKN